MANIAGTNIPKPTIKVTLTQQDIIHKYFNSDILLLNKYCRNITDEIDQNFKYLIFKDYIFSAADMMRDLDLPFYNKVLLNSHKTIKSLDDTYLEFRAKSKHVLTIYINEFLHWQEDYVTQKKRCEDLTEEIQMLVSKEKQFAAKLKKIDAKTIALKAKGQENIYTAEQEEKIKSFRKDYVDTIHLLGQNQKELVMLQGLLANFEEEHKALFQSYFQIFKEKLNTQYIKSLNYFSFKFNTKLFLEVKKSQAVQKFKTTSNIRGDLSLCTYAEYHMKNIDTDTMCDLVKRENMKAVKLYCKNKRERESLY